MASRQPRVYALSVVPRCSGLGRAKAKIANVGVIDGWAIQLGISSLLITDRTECNSVLFPSYETLGLVALFIERFLFCLIILCLKARRNIGRAFFSNEKMDEKGMMNSYHSVCLMGYHRLRMTVLII